MRANMCLLRVVSPIIMMVGVSAQATPTVVGNIIVVGNQANTVLVFGGAISGTVKFGFLALTGALNTSGAPTVNVNSISISGNNSVLGNISVQGNKVDDAIIIGGSANINSVVIGR